MKHIMRWMAVGSVVCWGLSAAGEPAPDTDAEPAAPVRLSGGTGGELQSLLSSGQQALAAGKWTEAEALFEKAVKLEPDSNEALFGLGVARIELDHLGEALPLLEKLRKAAPDNPRVMNNLAWIYVKSKDPAVRNPAQAVKLARIAVLTQPSDYSIWNTLAEAYYADSNYAPALRAAQCALRLSRMAGVTNDTLYVELVSRCRRAGAKAGSNDDNP